MLSKSIIGLLFATAFACQDNRNAEFKHPATDEKRDTATKIPNIYAELLDSIKAKYQSVSILKDKPLQTDSTAEKLKAIGFYSNAKLYEDQNDAVMQARSKFKIIEHYRDKYQYLPFIYNDAEGIIYSEDGWIEFYGEILDPISKKYDMRIFNASSFTGIIPDSIAQRLLNFKYGSIRKDDLREIACALDVYDKNDKSDKTTLGGEIIFGNPTEIRKNLKKEHDENPYHDYDISFRILAPDSLGSKVKDPIVLFPVKHGYLIVAQWGFEWPQIKAENFTASLTGENITIVLPDSTAPIVLSEGEKAIRSAHDIMISILFQQTPPDDGQIPYLINTGLYFLSPEDAQYIDSLKAKAQEQ